MAKGTVPFGLRLPGSMRERLKEVAAENHRSMNAEIVYHLQRAIYDPVKLPENEKGAAPAS